MFRLQLTMVYCDQLYSLQAHLLTWTRLWTCIPYFL